MNEPVIIAPELTEKKASEILIIRPNTLASWRATGTGPAYYRLKGKIRYKLADIQKFLDESRVEPGRKKNRRRLAE